MQQEEIVEKVVVARTLHKQTNSYLRSFFNPSNVKITLFSDGTILSDRTDPLSETDSGVNLNDVKLSYSFCDDNGNTYLRTMVILSVIITVWYLIFISFFDFEDFFTKFTFEHGGMIFSFLFWAVWDVARDKMLVQESLTINTPNGGVLEIRGDLPNQDIHRLCALIFLVSTIFFVGIYGQLYTAGRASEYLFLLWLLGGFMLLFFMTADWVLGENEHIPTLSSNQFYLAIMNTIGNDYGPNAPRTDVEDIEFSKVKKRLDKYQPIFGDIVAAQDIFASKSPSLIVIAIGATTERLMKKACDSLGITQKPNARPTLQSFIQQYQTKKPLNEKSITQLNLIKEFRNRAAHHFNIDWDESVIVLNQFCQFVEWYADSHTYEESE